MKPLKEKTKKVLRIIGHALLALIGIVRPKVAEVIEEVTDEVTELINDQKNGN